MTGRLGRRDGAPGLFAEGIEWGSVSLQSRLRDRRRPWHGLMVLVLVAGMGVSLSRAGTVTTRTAVGALVSGLFGLVIFQFTVGNVWGYAVEYHNAGGSWTDLPFLTPFGLAGLAGVVAGVWSGRAGLALWVAFWIFVIVAAAVAVGVWVLAGYRNAEA
ncbi:hypothetical protein [Haloplanus pelagicus]|uniref:hypothetical protein n=1 Tax=Haloplanus pelagicus TaxID=2949995 RepID=UPI00203D5E10|nr:hypothetical protein [Haloplanus sp. HW8-1]